MNTIERFQRDSEFYIEEGCHITELHNSTADPDCSIARARLEPGRATRLHCLRGIVERYVILEGCAEVRTGNETLQTVQPLDVVNIPAGVAQNIVNTGPSDLIFLCICTPRFSAVHYQGLEEQD